MAELLIRSEEACVGLYFFYIYAKLVGIQHHTPMLEEKPCFLHFKRHFVVFVKPEKVYLVVRSCLVLP